VLGEPKAARCSKKLAVYLGLIFSAVATTKKLVHGGAIGCSTPLGGLLERFGQRSCVAAHGWELIEV
jgi:hypothetical protein